ncbi:hypothetical protein [Acinetobacter oleivorans]|uniref:hypothetical protein n=1 Tax=Acinetobacter oleivorans TaxID=1148157 RepID=UPI003AF94EE9
MNAELNTIEQKETEAPLQELGYLFALIEEDRKDDKQSNETSMRVLRGLDAISRLIEAIITKVEFKAHFESISQLINRKKLDERERTKQISNRLKREATVFQLIKYSNHLVSLFPIPQTMNYIEA